MFVWKSSPSEAANRIYSKNKYVLPPQNAGCTRLAGSLYKLFSNQQLKTKHYWFNIWVFIVTAFFLLFFFLKYEGFNPGVLYPLLIFILKQGLIKFPRLAWNL